MKKSRAKDPNNPKWAEPKRWVKVKGLNKVVMILAKLEKPGYRVLSDEVNGFRLWSVESLFPANKEEMKNSEQWPPPLDAEIAKKVLKNCSENIVPVEFEPEDDYDWLYSLGYTEYGDNWPGRSSNSKKASG